jgi:UDP-N-acetylmuramate dehydrogenase
MFFSSKTKKIFFKRINFFIIVGMIRYNKNISLLPYNTFGIDVNASHLFYLRSPDELAEILDLPGFNEMSDNMNKLLVLGQGSNILFINDFTGVVIKNEIDGISIIEENESSVILEAGSGVKWNDLVDYTVSKNWSGIENLTLIPGTVGAAPVQNIGAYGIEAADVIVRVNAFHIEKREWLTLDNSDCEFGYRDSIFKRKLKNKVIICSVVFRLSKRHELKLDYGGIREEIAKRNITDPAVSDISAIIAGIRRSILPDPATLGNAGSFFKNPFINEFEFQRLFRSHPLVRFYKQDDLYKISAGWLIEQAGWKGYRFNDTGCYDRQSLILVNYGKATGEDILALSEKIKASVFNKFGITLEREVNIIG